ncbi:MAG: 4-alpha-glucanotransferase, partial [Chloroflexota bacterium]
MFKRLSGILLHPSSLPGKFGIGDLGESAYRFVDFLDKADQGLWQILPLGPTSYGDSPYQCFSAFAGNPLLVSPDLMYWDGYISQELLDSVPDFPTDKVDYGWVIYWKNVFFEKAYAWFMESGDPEKREAFVQFCQARAWWLDDYALFMALKGEHVEHEGGVWSTWPADIRD